MNYNQNPMNPMMMPHHLYQPPSSSWQQQQVLINYHLSEHRVQLPGYGIAQVEMFDGRATFANVPANSTEITVFRFSDFSWAQFVFNSQNHRESATSLTGAISNVAKIRFMCYTDMFTDVVFEKLPYFTIYKWHFEVQRKIMCLFDDENMVVGLDQDIQQIMKKILKGLHGLHDAGLYHGNLIYGLWFNIDHNLNAEVRFANFGVADDLEAGIKKDIKDLNELLGWVIEANLPCTINPEANTTLWPPIDVCSFRLHVTSLIHGMNHEKLRRAAYFVYNHPVFNNVAENYKLLRKIFFIKKQSQNTFNKGVTLGDFIDWHKTVKGDYYFYNDSIHAWADPTYLLNFHINTVKHHKANNINEHDAQDLILLKLQKLFPGFVATLYSEFSAFDTTSLQPWNESNDELLKSGILPIN